MLIKNISKKIKLKNFIIFAFGTVFQSLRSGTPKNHN